MTMILPADAPRFQRSGAEFTGLAAPSRGSRENAVWRLSLAPGAPPVVHQLTREEVFVALSGSARVTLAGAAHELPAGAALIVPPDTDFSLANTGSVPFEAIAVLPVG